LQVRRRLPALVPHRVPKRSPLGIWKGKVIIKGDIISPMDVEWDALKCLQAAFG
jgi:hypothetical protein